MKYFTVEQRKEFYEICVKEGILVYPVKWSPEYEKDNNFAIWSLLQEAFQRDGSGSGIKPWSAMLLKKQME